MNFLLVQMKEMGKKMDKQTKSVVVQWIGPLILLIIALAIMVFNFSAKSKAKAYDAVTKNMTSSAESCLVNFTQQLATFQVISEPIAELLELPVFPDTVL